MGTESIEQIVSRLKECEQLLEKIEYNSIITVELSKEISRLSKGGFNSYQKPVGDVIKCTMQRAVDNNLANLFFNNFEQNR